MLINICIIGSTSEKNIYSTYSYIIADDCAIKADTIVEGSVLDTNTSDISGISSLKSSIVARNSKLEAVKSSNS